MVLMVQNILAVKSNGTTSMKTINITYSNFIHCSCNNKLEVSNIESDQLFSNTGHSPENSVSSSSSSLHTPTSHTTLHFLSTSQAFFFPCGGAIFSTTIDDLFGGQQNNVKGDDPEVPAYVYVFDSLFVNNTEASISAINGRYDDFI
jgi:hypothetical protein